MHATLLVGGTVVELDPPRVERVDVVMHGDRIGDVSREIPTTSTVNCTDCLIVPGFVVAHTHLYSGLAAGMPAPIVPPLTFNQILEKVWWRLDRALDEETLRASVEAAAISAIRSGVTCLIDHHESPSFIDGSLDVITEVLDELGLRALLCYGATDRHGPEAARAGLRESERFAVKTKADPMIRGAIGLHAPFTCSDHTLEDAADRAKANDAWLHFHAAEGPDDQAAARSRWNQPLMPHLDSVGLLGERTLLAHAVDVDEAEVGLIDQRRAWVAHQPRSNMNNGVGFASRIRGLRRMALGTDGIDNDPIRELTAAFFRQREAVGPSVWPDPVDLLARGHRLASAVFGAPFGSISPGAAGDLAVIAYDSPTPLDARTLGAHLLFGFPSAHVRDLFVAGRAVMRNRRVVGIDERRVFQRTREMAEKLWARMGAS